MSKTVNALEAWLGSLPGHVYANVRQPPVSSLRICASHVPLSAVWAGAEKEEHFWGGRPLLVAQDGGFHPIPGCGSMSEMWYNVVIGPTGAGNSGALALMALQFRRYPGSSVVVDSGGSIPAAMLGMGGEWHDLGGCCRTERPGWPACSHWHSCRILRASWAAAWIVVLLRL